MYFSVSETGLLLGICPTTIRRWDINGLIKWVRTQGNHIRMHSVADSWNETLSACGDDVRPLDVFLRVVSSK